MSKLLAAIRQEYDAALAAAEETGAAPEGVSTLPAARELTGTPVPWWESTAVSRATPPKAA